ncbi:helix-turn-helix transcriptional regulator [Priestia megaterium]|nr:helix-turn-helix transcriptional regulator [Priestia megaterium]MBT2253852.1 helix-turn-helix transcriptional regulator [Priestia megaterium]MCA4158040.1 helix-turn-helix transcriptional regulator [Priestia megaterium]MDN4865892.1 helix-turn-helix transcriptional regulator [Priestia megaterium]
MPKITKKSKLGKYLMEKGYTQTEFVKITNINRLTVSKIFNDSNYIPSGSTIKKVMNLLKKHDSKLKAEDFFNI